MPGMPMSAVQNVEVDYILKPRAIGEKLASLVCEQVPDAAALVPEGVDVAEGQDGQSAQRPRAGAAVTVYVS